MAERTGGKGKRSYLDWVSFYWLVFPLFYFILFYLVKLEYVYVNCDGWYLFCSQIRDLNVAHKEVDLAKPKGNEKYILPLYNPKRDIYTKSALPSPILYKPLSLSCYLKNRWLYRPRAHGLLTHPNWLPRLSRGSSQATAYGRCLAPLAPGCRRPLHLLFVSVPV